MATKNFIGLGTTVAGADKLTPPSKRDKDGKVISVPSEIPALTTYSEESKPVPYSTIFNAFDLTVEPIYNFYVQDEEKNEIQTEADLVDTARYIVLRWKKSPATFVLKDEIPNKSVRTPIPKYTAPDHIMNNGLSFDVSHLKDFSLIKSSIANHSISPGAISSVIEITNDDSMVTTKVIDEESYLISEDYNGLAIHEVQSNIFSRGSEVDIDDVSDDELVDGKFLIQKSQGSIMVKSVHSSSPSISFEASTPLKKSAPVLSYRTSDARKVSFVDPAIDGLFTEDKVNSVSRPEHAENLLSLAQIAPNLQMISIVDPFKGRKPVIPSFQSPRQFSGVEYIGYVIEKYKRSTNGVFELVEEIDIPDREKNSHIDTKVVYGGVYRYRIKTIVRWTRTSNIEVEGLVLVDSTESPFSQASPLADKKSSYFESEWSNKWVYAAIIDTIVPSPPDELMVRPESNKRQVFVSWKIPYDPQKDILGFYLYRKVLKNGVETDWIRLGDLYPPVNGYYVDHDVEYSQDLDSILYVYTMQTVSRHNEKSVLSEQIGCALNPDFRFSGEFDIKFISQAGVSLVDHGSMSTIPHKRNIEELIAKDVIAITGRTGMLKRLGDDTSYVISIQSLDVGKTVYIPIELTFNTVKTKTVEIADVVKVGTLKPPEIPKGSEIPAASGKKSNKSDKMRSVSSAAQKLLDASPTKTR